MSEKIKKKDISVSEAASVLYQTWKKKSCNELMIPIADRDGKDTRFFVMRISVEPGPTMKEMNQDLIKYMWSLK